MNRSTREVIGRVISSFFAVIGAITIVSIVLSWTFGDMLLPRASAQSDLYLSRRIDQLENRLYLFESRMNRLEQDSRRVGITPSNTQNSDLDVVSLRSQIDSMRLRLGEAECALLKLDERTLTPAARAARRRATSGGTELCRVDPSAPVHLSARP